MRAGMDDQIGCRSIHSLILDDHLLLVVVVAVGIDLVVSSLELVSETEAFRGSGRFGNQNGDPVPL